MNNIIKIECDKTINVLVGFDAGKNVYVKQVKDKMIFDKKVTIMIPDNVKRIGSSFVQGFFEEIKEKMGIKGIEDFIEIKSHNIDFKKDVIENLI